MRLLRFPDLNVVNPHVQVSARAFVERPDKKGQQAGEVGIEGTTIEEPDKVRGPALWPCRNLVHVAHQSCFLLAAAMRTRCQLAVWHDVLRVSDCWPYVLVERWAAPLLILSETDFAQGTPTLEELKLQYYRLYIQYYQQEHNYLEICRCYRAIYDTPSVLAEPSQWQPVRSLVPYLVLLVVLRLPVRTAACQNVFCTCHDMLCWAFLTGAPWEPGHVCCTVLHPPSGAGVNTSSYSCCWTAVAAVLAQLVVSCL